MVCPTYLQHIHQGALGEGDGIFVLAVGEVVGGEEVVELGEYGVELAVVLGGQPDVAITYPYILVTIFDLHCPFYLHYQLLELPLRRHPLVLHLVQSQVSKHATCLFRRDEEGQIFVDLGLKFLEAVRKRFV